MHKFFNPGKFIRLMDKIMPFFIFGAISLLLSGLYFALFASPADYQQGEVVRIMYVHVPAAWMALGIYSFMAMSSIAWIVWKNPFANLMAASAAPIGAAFTLICLVTGSIWGKPTWGTWWVWDARLTSVLILLFFYIGYIALYNAYEDKVKAGKICAILAIVGFINIPIIKFSVNWWNTLHQSASVMRAKGIAIDPSMLLPLMVMFGAYIFIFMIIFIIRLKTEFLQKKIDSAGI